jgi:hypothetical protein
VMKIIIIIIMIIIIEEIHHISQLRTFIMYMGNLLAMYFGRNGPSAVKYIYLNVLRRITSLKVV